MPYRITPEQIASLEYDLDAEIAKYQVARESHKATEGVPAPTAPQIVETIVKKFGGEYEVIALIPYARVIDGKVMDIRRLSDKPLDPEWVRVQPGMKVGYVWDKDTEVWRKADEGKGATAKQVEQSETKIAAIIPQIKKLQTDKEFLSQQIAALQAELEDVRKRLNEVTVVIGS